MRFYKALMDTMISDEWCRTVMKFNVIAVIVMFLIGGPNG